MKDLTGMRVGKLQVESPSHQGKDGRWNWNCKCDYGNSCCFSVTALTGGLVYSCGCHKLKKQLRSKDPTRKRLKTIFNSMLQRCYNPNVNSYHNYGGRGIFICSEWKNNFELFYEWALSSGYGAELTIDRIDNNGPYSPENCRWATNEEQARNKSNNYLIKYKGEELPLKEWALKIGIDYHVLHHRLKYWGWTIEEAFTTPSSLHNRIKKQIKFNGESLTAAEWGRKFGIEGRSILYRLAAGWSVEDALLTPPHKKPKGNYTKVVGKKG